MTPILSDSQFAVLDAVGIGGAWQLPPLLAVTGARPATVSSLNGLGLVAVRAAGAREPLIHLTQSGRVLWGALNDDDPAGAVALTNGKEVIPMTAETTTTPQAKPDPKPAKKTTAKKTTTTPEVPPVEDITGKAPEAALEKEKADYSPLYKELLSAVKQAAGRGATTVERGPRTRVVVDGKTVAFVKKPTTRSVRVKVPQAEGSKYDIVQAHSSDDVPAVLSLVEARVALLTEKKTEAKAAKKADEKVEAAA